MIFLPKARKLFLCPLLQWVTRTSQHFILGLYISTLDSQPSWWVVMSHSNLCTDIDRHGYRGADGREIRTGNQWAGKRNVFQPLTPWAPFRSISPLRVCGARVIDAIIHASLTEYGWIRYAISESSASGISDVILGDSPTLSYEQSRSADVAARLLLFKTIKRNIWSLVNGYLGK